MQLGNQPATSTFITYVSLLCILIHVFLHWFFCSILENFEEMYKTLCWRCTSRKLYWSFKSHRKDSWVQHVQDSGWTLCAGHPLCCQCVFQIPALPYCHKAYICSTNRSGSTSALSPCTMVAPIAFGPHSFLQLLPPVQWSVGHRVAQCHRHSPCPLCPGPMAGLDVIVFSHGIFGRGEDSTEEAPRPRPPDIGPVTRRCLRTTHDTTIQASIFPYAISHTYGSHHTKQVHQHIRTQHTSLKVCLLKIGCPKWHPFPKNVSPPQNLNSAA